MLVKNLLTLMVMMNGIVFNNTEYINNVGTVLFSTSDLDKRRWNTDDIGLLKARRYFQNLLPPPLFVSRLNENYVDLLFNYFREAYSAIKRETDDPNMDRTMTTALSDSIGGYLKAWVLPVTKFAFYGGTISEQNVTTLFEFYDEIKRYLRTDGDGWHRPKTNLFDVSIKTADSKLPTVAKENNVDPCDHFVFFEKTPEGLSVPIPHVSWDGAASKLFLPLKNHSIYAMNSTNSSSVLLKYYETAKYCLQRRYPSMLHNFDARFQSWLTNEVVPHLGDDDVYLALGSVLTVMNKTRELYDSVLYMYENKPKLCKKVHAFAFTKKVMIVTLLIVIEVVWCCIALIYTCYTKKKKNKVSQVYLFVEPRPPDTKDKSYNTQEAFGRKPFGIKESVTSKDGEAVQTNVDTLFMRGKCCNTRCKCPTDVPPTVTQSVGVITGDSSNASHPKVHNKKLSKRNSSHSEFSVLCRSSISNTAVPNTSTKTIINTVGTESNRRLHKNNKQTDKKDVKKIVSQKIEKTRSVTKVETRKSIHDVHVPSSKRELKTSESRRSSRNKGTEVLKSKRFPDVTKIVQVEVISKEQSIDTTEFLKSENFFHTTGTQNVPPPINSSKILNTDLSINNNAMINEEIQCIEAVKTTIDSTNTDKMEKSVSFLNMIDECKTETDARNIADVPAANFQLVTKETLIIENPKFIDKKQTVNILSEKHSLHTVEPQKIIEISRCVNSRNQEFTTYPSQQKLDKDCKDLNSKSFITIESKVSTPKRSKKLETFAEEVTSTRSSGAKKKKSAKSETKSPRLSIQKEFKDKKYYKEPYWEITIDEPQHDVYVDIKGSIKMDSRNVKRSRIPKLSVRTIEAGTAFNTPRASRAGSLIPQLKKKAVDDLVFKANAENNKLNTSI